MAIVAFLLVTTEMFFAFEMLTAHLLQLLKFCLVVIDESPKI